MIHMILSFIQACSKALSRDGGAGPWAVEHLADFHNVVDDYLDSQFVKLVSGLIIITCKGLLDNNAT